MHGALPPGTIITPARRKHFFGYTHQFAAGAQTGAITAGQLGASDTIQITRDADFLRYGSVGIITPAGAGQVKLVYQVNSGRRLSSKPLYIAGTLDQQFPHWLTQAERLRGGDNFIAFVDDRQAVTVAATLRVLHIGVKEFPALLEPARAYHSQEPFSYVADYTAEGLGAIAASKTVPTAVTIDADADFEIWKIMIVSDSQDATLDIISSYKAIGWFNTPAYLTNLGATGFNSSPSTGGWPFRLPLPVYLPFGSALQVIATDLSAASNRMQVIFEGRKLMPPGGLPIDSRLLMQYEGSPA